MLRSALTAAALAVFLVVCAPAHAAPLVPVVPGVTVIYAPCPLPDTEFSDGCTWRGASAVYVSPPANKVTQWHELGHQFAFRALADSGSGPLTGAMLKFKHLTRQIEHARFVSDVREQFADAYAACALGEHPVVREWGGGGFFPTGHDYNPTARVQRAVCAMIRRAGARRGF